MTTYDHPAVILDVETCSPLALGSQKSVGAERYAVDPKTHFLCLSYQIGLDGKVKRWRPGDPLPVDLIDAPSQGYLIYATNAPFDRAIWREILAKRHGWPYPGDHVFMDLAVLQSYAGLPRSVEGAAGALGTYQQKDIDGKKLMQKLAKPLKPTKYLTDEWRHHTPEALEALEEYCDQDVRAEADICRRVPMMPAYLRRAWSASERMNARGVLADIPFAHKAVHVLSIHQQRARARLSTITGGQITTEGQQERIGDLLLDAGYEVAHTPGGGVAMDKDAIGPLLQQARDRGDSMIEEVLSIRQEMNKSSVAKYHALIRCALPQTNRLHGMLVFHGAHTGRWTGSLVQLQNLPKGDAFSESMLMYGRELVNRCAYDDLVMFFGTDFMDLMGALVRTALMAREGHILHVSDYSAIEGRGLAWLAGEAHIIQAYIDGLDMYRVNAAATYGITYDGVDGGAPKGPQRSMGKVGELAGGFGGGPGAFKKMAAKSGISLTTEEAEHLRDKWRANRPATVALWKSMQRAAVYAIKHPGALAAVEGTKGRVVFRVKNRTLLMKLPSGRLLYYREPSVGEKIAPWSKDGDPQFTEAVFYMGVDPEKKVWGKQDTYGGKLTENAVQALCADLLYEALPRLESHGYSPVLTVHDEILSEDPEDMADIDAFSAIMSQAPDWADGFPIESCGFVTKYYRKD